MAQVGDNDFATRLRELSASREMVTGARVAIVDLQSVKEQVGSRWPRLSERIHTLLSRIIEKRLGPDDFFSRIGDGNYMVVFGDDKPEAARLKVAMLDEEISRTMFGAAESFQSAAAQSVIAEMPVGAVEAMGFSSTAMAQEIERAAAGRSRRARAGPVPGGSGAGATASLEDGLGMARDVLRQVERELASGGEPKKATMDALRPVARTLRHLDRIVRGIVESDDGLKAWADEYLIEWGGRHYNAVDGIRALSAVANRQIEALTDPWEEKGGGLAMNFEPIFYQPKKTVGLYRAQLSIELPGEQITYATALENAADPEFIGELDKVAFRMASGELGGVLGTRQASAVAIPVSFRTLNWPRGQREMIGEYRSISTNVCRLIVWEIHDAPMEIWASRLAPVVNLLKPYGRMAWVCIAPTNTMAFSALLRGSVTKFAALASAGVRGVVVSCRDLPGAEADKFKTFDMLCEAADKHGLSVAVTNVPSLSLAMAAIGSGVQYVSGEAIADPHHHLSGVGRQYITDLYMRRFGRIMNATG